MKNARARMSTAALVVGVIIGAAIAVRARRQPTWAVEMCYTDSCVTKTLDRLPADRAAEAKVSEGETFYKVWYRK